MKYIFQLLFIFFLNFSACASLPVIHVVRCPDSNELIKFFYPELGLPTASIWSDGYADQESMYLMTPLITKCEHGKYFWIKEASLVGVISFIRLTGEVYPEAWNTTKFTNNLSESDYLEAIDNGLGTTIEKEIYLRKQAWHAANHTATNNRKKSAEKNPFFHSSSAKTNLEKLIPLLNSSNWLDRLLKAEVFRELGRFDEALAIIEKTKPDNADLSFDRFYFDLIKLRKTAVEKLKFEK